jgi:hypothetical protein
MWQRWYAHKVLLGKPKGKRPLGINMVEVRCTQDFVEET